MKSQMGTFHEVLPGNLVFFHFFYTGTKETTYLDQTIRFYMKNYILGPNFSSGGEILSKTIADQSVATYLL